MSRRVTHLALRCLVTKAKGKHDQPRDSQRPEKENKPVVLEMHIFPRLIQSLRKVSPSDLRKGSQWYSKRFPTTDPNVPARQFLTSPAPLAIQRHNPKRTIQPKWGGHFTPGLSYLIYKMIPLADQTVVRVKRDNR